MPSTSRPARGLTEFWRCCREIAAWLGWRADRLERLLGVMRSLARHADHRTRRSRPGHRLIAKETGYSPRTICRAIDDAHRLGLLVTTELGSTPRIRLGWGRGRDPFAGQENRAQEYQLCVRRAVIDGPPASPAPVDAGVLAGQGVALESVHPSCGPVVDTSVFRVPANARARGGLVTIRAKPRRAGRVRAGPGWRADANADEGRWDRETTAAQRAAEARITRPAIVSARAEARAAAEAAQQRRAAGQMPPPGPERLPARPGATGADVDLSPQTRQELTTLRERLRGIAVRRKKP